jgi:hypothetical protein
MGGGVKRYVGAANGGRANQVQVRLQSRSSACSLLPAAQDLNGGTRSTPLTAHRWYHSATLSAAPAGQSDVLRSKETKDRDRSRAPHGCMQRQRSGMGTWP